MPAHTRTCASCLVCMSSTASCAASHLCSGIDSNSSISIILLSMHLCEVDMAPAVGPASCARGQGWMPRVDTVGGVLIFLMLGVHQLRLSIVLRSGRRLVKMCVPARKSRRLCFLNSHQAVALCDVYRGV